MSDVLRLAVVVLVIVNPISVALALRAASDGRGRTDRVTMLAVSAAVALAVLGAAALAADAILDALEISDPAAQLAAGIVLLVPTLELLFGGPDGWVRTGAANTPAVRLGAYPLGVPVFATPWAAAAVLALAAVDGGGTVLGALAIAVAGCALLAGLYTTPADRRAVRMLGIAVGVATAVIAADLVRDGVLST